MLSFAISILSSFLVAPCEPKGIRVRGSNGRGQLPRTKIRELPDSVHRFGEDMGQCRTTSQAPARGGTVRPVPATATWQCGFLPTELP